MFGKLNKSRRTPINAILLQTALTIAFIVVGGGFRTLVNFLVVASWSFYFLTVRGDCFLAYSGGLSVDMNKVLGLVILRVKEPNLERYGCVELLLTMMTT